MLRYRDPLIIFGGIVCFIEFIVLGQHKPTMYAGAIGLLHLFASIVLLLTVILYMTTWKKEWSLVLRIIFAGFILFIMVSSFRLSLEILTN